jgi:uncharacterized membrane protein
MPSRPLSKTTEFLFRFGMIVKGVDSLFEVLGGVILTMPTKLARYILVVSQHEAFRHHTTLAGRLDRLADSVAMHPSMIEAIYLMVHGLAKVVLIAAIVMHKRWGYIGFIAVLSLFSLIELTRAATAHEIVTAVFGLFDVCVVVLIYREYRSRFEGG